MDFRLPHGIHADFFAKDVIDVPFHLDIEAIKDEQKLRDLKWLAGIVTDLYFSPGMTQDALEDNLVAIRSAYKEMGVDGIFITSFRRIVDAIVKSHGYEETGLVLRTPYTADDFLYTEEPYAEIKDQKTAFRKEQVTAQLQKLAEKLGVKTFKKMLAQYDRGMEEQVIEGREIVFPICKNGEKIHLDAGDWHISSQCGIWRERGDLKEYACTHPIAPVKRLVNIDTGEQKLIIAFERNGRFCYIEKPKRELFDAKKVIDLSMIGVAVTSKSAGILAEYLADIEDRNYNEITEQSSVTRLGWIDDGQFSPYVEDLAFDGASEYGTIFNSIHPKGDFDKWREHAIKCREYSVTAHIMLAASFASALISKIGGLPFFVHLWSGSAGTGKTVSLMLAASVWGDPEIGKYPQTFNATQVGHEKTAAFLRNIPMCIDELQLSKDSHGHSRFDVYQLAQGVGRTRGTKSGGIDVTPTWKLAILTTGESQIVKSSSGAGAYSRVIDIECKPDEKVIEDGFATCKIIKNNYGFAGKMFVENLTEEKIQEAQELYEKLFKELCSHESAEKQAASASIILIADKLADEFIFKTGKTLSVDDIEQFLQTKDSVSIGTRAYDYLRDWITINKSHFDDECTCDRYGVIDGDYVYIIRSVYRRVMDDAGFDEKAVLSWLKTSGKILTRGKNLTKNKRIDGICTECVTLFHDGINSLDDDEQTDISDII